MIPFWPLKVLEPERPHWDISGGMRVSGANGDGWPQSMGTAAGGYWTLTLGRIVIAEPQQVLAWRALRAQMRNGARPCIISIPDYAAAPWPIGRSGPTRVPFSDGSTFSDGSQFVSGMFDVQAAEAALRRAVSLRVNSLSGVEVQAGMVFSVIDEWGLPRRHEIGSAEVEDGAPAGQYLISFNPPLRSALAAEAALNFDDPGQVMKIANPESMFAPLVGSVFAEISPVFVEYFGRINVDDL